MRADRWTSARPARQSAHDYVARADASRKRGPFSSTPPRARHAPARGDTFGNLIVNFLNAHAQPTAARLAILKQLVDNRLDD